MIKTTQGLSAKRQKRVKRVRAKIYGTAKRPRLTVAISNRHVIAQLVDDDKGQTLAYTSSAVKKMSGTLTQKAASVGTEIAKAAKAAKIKRVVFDRRHKRYHGRIKALADAARQGGLEF